MPRRARTPLAAPQPLGSARFAARAPDVIIEEVTGPSSRDEFIRFQLDHYQGDPHFVPPIVAERRDFLDPSTNPLFQNARIVFYVARRGGRVVGRIAATIDGRYNRFHGTRDGFFGLFECQNDPGVAAALFEQASDWVRRGGMERLIGPISLAFHQDVGLLIEGFDRPPAMMMPYNPRFYRQLIEANGFTKLKDLWAYEATSLSDKIVRLADRARSSGQVRVRRLNTLHPDEDIACIKSIYESMLKPGFGLAPMTDRELAGLVHRLRPVILMRPELSLIAEVNGEPVAFAITVPDTNIAVKAAAGYLFPLGIARLLWAARKIDRLRVLLFGIKDGFRRRGIDALLGHETYLAATRLGYRTGEIAWALEDDTLINRTIQATGARRYKVYRLYERAVA